MILKSDAIILKTIKYGDSSLIVRLFTKNFGKINVIAKGARKPKNKFSSGLEPLNILQVNFYNKDNREIQTLKEASQIQSTISFRSNLDKLNIAFVMIDMLDHAVTPNNPAPILFRLITKSFKMLDSCIVNKRHYLWFFMIQLAVQIGFKPNLSHCEKCTKNLSDGYFNENLGELYCSDCGENTQTKISNKSRLILQQFITTNIEDIGDFKIDKQNHFEIRQLLWEFMRFHIEGISRVKSLEFIS
jgi:DNA repair protein RecO (recombination protein O)